MIINREKYHFEEITHLVDSTFGADRVFREIVGTFTGETVRTTIKHSDRFVILRADIDKRLAGTITVRIRPGEYHLMYLAVVEAFRGRGVATGLLEYIFDSFPGRVSKIICKTSIESFYLRFGFERVGETLTGMTVMERKPSIYSVDDPIIYPMLSNQHWEGSNVVIVDSYHKAERMYGQIYKGREIIINHLRGTPTVLNKASLAALALDFYPESSFHGRYNMIHAHEKHKVIKPVSDLMCAGVGIVQPGAKIYYTAGNSRCISQEFIPPHLDKDGYKYDLMTRVYISAAGVYWLHNGVFKRRCLEPFNPHHITFANATRFESRWSLAQKSQKMISDIEHVLETLFAKTFEKLFCGVYSGFQVIDIVMMYDEHEKLWLMDCNNTVLDDDGLRERILNARLKEVYEGMTKINLT